MVGAVQYVRAKHEMVDAFKPQTAMSGPSSVGSPRLLTGLTPQPATLCVSIVGLFRELATPVGVNLKGRGVPTDEGGRPGVTPTGAAAWDGRDQA